MSEPRNVAPFCTHIGGRYTMAGVIQNYFDELTTRNWLASTDQRYFDDYREKILPHLSERPFEDYEFKDFENAIQAIQDNQIKEKGIEKAYSSSTMQHYRYLIRIAVKKAVDEGILKSDVLWGSYFSLTKDDLDEVASFKKLLILPKSLSIDEDIQVFQILCTDHKISGPRMGLFLMYALGIRNGEACGVLYRDIHELFNYPGYYSITLYQTVEGKTGAIKRGGKTRNMPRKLVLYGIIYSFLMKRRSWLQEMIDSGEIILDENQNSADDLPIACSWNSYTQHCGPEDLTKEGRILLNEVRFPEKELSYIDHALQDESKQKEMTGVTEKDPTAYLLRRHLGMILSLLGFSINEIEAWMAHKIKDEESSRNDYVNEDLLYSIAKKLENRPLLNPIYPHQNDQLLNENTPQINSKNVGACHLHIQLKAGQSARVGAIAREAGSTLSGQISICDPNMEQHLKIIETTSCVEQARSGRANVISIIQEQYDKAYAKILAKADATIIG